jgi:hypothetical protein
VRVEQRKEGVRGSLPVEGAGQFLPDRPRRGGLEDPHAGDEGSRRERSNVPSRQIKDLSGISKAHVSAVMSWFKGIKLFEGKAANQIAYD